MVDDPAQGKGCTGADGDRRGGTSSRDGTSPDLAAALLVRLQDDPQVSSLVRTQGDEYLDHLRENPGGVQELVQGQSVGRVNEVLDVVGIDLQDCDQLAERRPLLASVCHWLLYLGPLAGTAFTLSYTLLFWSATGQTPGKAAMGVRVVRLNGRPMNLVTAIRRLAGYVLSLGPLGFGFHVILADDRRQGWHDKIAGTVVVYSLGASDERPTLRSWPALRSSPSERRRTLLPPDDGPS